MQIVIDIPEEVLNSIKTFKGQFICVNGYDLIQGIKDCVSLPTRGMDLNYGQISEVVDNAPTIIEADRSEKE